MVYNKFMRLYNETCFYSNLNGKNGMIIYGSLCKKYSKYVDFCKKCKEPSLDENNLKSTCTVESAKGNTKKFKAYIQFLYYKDNMFNEFHKIQNFFIFIEGNIKEFCGKRFNIFINRCGKPRKTCNMFKSIKMYFPLLNINLKYNSNIIFTMVKNYNHRLDEWIKYNLKLGFDSIVLFDNSKNTNNIITEKESVNENIHEITNKYKNVHVVNFPYRPINENNSPKETMNYHEIYDQTIKINTIQSIAFQISVNSFKFKCRYIALIDADEFIYIPNSNNNIKDFLSNYNENLIIKSNLLTNKSNNDVLNNNILEICRYNAGDKYTKSIIYCPSIIDKIHVIKHHDQDHSTILNKDKIIHYHCWANNRCIYNETMEKIDHLYLFYKK